MRSITRLNWEVNGLTLNNTPIIQETSGQLIGDTAGLALAIHTFTGQIGDEAFALEEPARVSVDAGSAELTLAAMPLRSAGGMIDFSLHFEMRTIGTCRPALSTMAFSGAAKSVASAAFPATFPHFRARAPLLEGAIAS